MAPAVGCASESSAGVEYVSQVVTSEAVSGLGGALWAVRGLAGAPRQPIPLPSKKLAKECRRWRDQEPQSSGLQPVLNAPVNFSVWFHGGIKTSFLLALDT